MKGIVLKESCFGQIRVPSTYTILCESLALIHTFIFPLLEDIKLGADRSVFISVDFAIRRSRGYRWMQQRRRKPQYHHQSFSSGTFTGPNSTIRAERHQWTGDVGG